MYGKEFQTERGKSVGLKNKLKKPWVPNSNQFPNLMRDIKPQIHEVKWTPCDKLRNLASRHSTVKLLKTEKEKKNLKAAIEKQHT